MSFKLDRLFPGSPNVERGRPVFIKEHPQGKVFIFGSARCVVLLDIEDPTKNETVIKHLDEVTAVSCQPAGYFVASGDRRGNLNVWSMENVDHTSRLEIQPISHVIYDCDWTADSKRIVVVGKGKEELAKVFQWDTGATTGKIVGHSGEILSCAMKPQRPFRIATGGADNLVNFYKGPPFKMESSFRRHDSFVNCVRYAPDGSVFASCSTDKNMYFFDGKTGEKINQIRNAHKSSIYGVAFSPDSKQFITCSGDKTVKLWSYEGLKEEKVLTFGKETDDIQLGVHWSPKHGPIAINLAGDLVFLDLENPEKPKRVISGHHSKITDLAFDPASGNVFTSAMDGVIRWDVQNGSVGRVKGKQPKNGVQAVAVLGEDLVVAGMDQTLFITKMNDMTLTGATKIEGIGCLVNKLATNSAGFVFGATKKGIAVIKDRKLVTMFETDLECLTIACHENLVVVGQKGLRKPGSLLWFEFDGASGFKLLEKYENDETHKGAISALKFNQDGSLLASGDVNKQICVFEVASRKLKYWQDLVFHDQKITFFDWAADGKTLLSSSQDKTIKVWNLEGKSRVSVLAHQLGCAVCKFVDGGKKVVSMGQDYVFKVWDVEY